MNDGPYRDGAAGRLCPRCLVGLDARQVGDATVDECGACAGVFVARELMQRMLDPLDLGGEVMADFERGTPSPLTPGPLYVKCPTCQTLMNRRQFATGAKVVVDVCSEHGMWFDRAELRAVVEFAGGGGLERAAHADAERRAAEERERRVAEAAAGGIWTSTSRGRQDRFLDFVKMLFR